MPSPAELAEAQAEIDAANAARSAQGLKPVPTTRDLSQKSSHDPQTGTVNLGNNIKPAAAPDAASSRAHASMRPRTAAAHEMGHASGHRVGADARKRFDADDPMGAQAGASAEEAQASARAAFHGKTLDGQDRDDAMSESGEHMAEAQDASAAMQGEEPGTDHPGKMFVDLSQETDPENRRRSPTPAAGRKPDGRGGSLPFDAPDGTSRF